MQETNRNHQFWTQTFICSQGLVFRTAEILVWGDQKSSYEINLLGVCFFSWPVPSPIYMSSFFFCKERPYTLIHINNTRLFFMFILSSVFVLSLMSTMAYTEISSTCIWNSTRSCKLDQGWLRWFQSSSFEGLCCASAVLFFFFFSCFAFLVSFLFSFSLFSKMSAE